MAKKPMTMKRFEGSAADEKVDKAGAKKAGMSRKAWEGSKADKAADRNAVHDMSAKEKLTALPARPGPSKLPPVRSTTKNGKY